MSAAGLPHPEPRRGTNDFACGAAAAAELLRGDDVTAMVCVSDLMGLGALSAARDAGRTVGSDLAVIGFDNSDAAQAAESVLAEPAAATGGRALPADRLQPDPAPGR